MYLGPDLLMPLASAFAAVMGIMLMFWKRIVASVQTLYQSVARKISSR